MAKKPRLLVIRLLALIGLGFAVLPGLPRYDLDTDVKPTDEPKRQGGLGCGTLLIIVLLLLVALAIAKELGII